MVAVDAPVDGPRVSHPLHVFLLDEEVVQLVRAPVPEVVPRIVRCRVSPLRRPTKEGRGRAGLVRAEEGA